MRNERRGQQVKHFEVEFFDALAESDYDEHGDSFYDIFLGFIGKIETSDALNTLEVGTGTGAFGKRLIGHLGNVQVLGIDISPRMVSRANDGTPGYTATIGDVENAHTFEPASFDLIVAPFVLHHLPSLSLVFRNFQKWLKPQGRIFIVEPNGANPVDKVSKKIRDLIVRLLGPQFIIQRALATPNETGHSLRDFENAASSTGLRMVRTQAFLRSEVEGKTLRELGVRDRAMAIVRKIFPSREFSTDTVMAEFRATSGS